VFPFLQFQNRPILFDIENDHRTHLNPDPTIPTKLIHIQLLLPPNDQIEETIVCRAIESAIYRQKLDTWFDHSIQ
jgi:hypothetical protein